MVRFSFKIAKMGLWVFVLMILISGTKFNSKTLEDSFFSGEYVLKASGDLNQDLIGVINFENTVSTTGSGVQFSTLKLILDNDDQNAHHSMEFLIAKKNGSGQISNGSYKVSRGFDGFLNYFNGVFGYANIDALGELPFFTKSGKIKIEYLNEDSLAGTLQVSLRNTNDELINLKGEFVATKKR